VTPQETKRIVALAHATRAMSATLEELDEEARDSLVGKLGAANGAPSTTAGQLAKLASSVEALDYELEAVLTAERIELDMANLSIAEMAAAKRISLLSDPTTLDGELERIRGAISTLAGQNRQLFSRLASDSSTLNRERKHWTKAAENAEAIQKQMRRGPTRVLVGRALHSVKHKGDVVRMEPLDAEES